MIAASRETCPDRSGYPPEPTVRILGSSSQWMQTCSTASSADFWLRVCHACWLAGCPKDHVDKMMGVFMWGIISNS